MGNVMPKYIYYDAASIVNTVFLKSFSVCIHVHACVYKLHAYGGHGSQERVSDPLVLESQAV